MKKRKVVEKHATMDEPVYDKLVHIAKKEDRTMRAVISRLINNEFERIKNA